ncbi:SMI1/KNR4 family protein [Mesobacillus subterraneus]|uniref:SMI1/KNR4 family protein n=1 Tax=Mesobacillus subterraneus TaxID=285983 RepID=A0A3R9FWL4_9BACI|nr:SMI1/KNR4 family protein [Mesobacillus subterraneus]RSD26850.1 SMI1/KNR4 family protein [Mesobacillus subterraneus]
MKKIIDKILEFNGPVENYKQSGLTLVYLSKELKEDRNIVFPDNVAHAFFAPATDESILTLEKENQHQFPEVYKELIKECNGFSLESGCLSLFGLPLGLWEGFSQKEKAFFGMDVIYINQSYAPRKIANKYFIIGRDYYNGNWIGINDNKIHVINKYGKLLGEVDFIAEILESVEEYSRNAEETIAYIKDQYK